MSTNGTTYTTIDRRHKLPCGCGCGQEATLPHFTKDDGKLILPGCLESHHERQAAQRELREIACRQQGFWRRAGNFRRVYRLQRGIFARQGASTARKSALRSAAIYLCGRRAGLWLSLVWRKG